MRTNKQNRLAYNFTKMAAYINDIEWNYEFQEAAKDAGLAMIAYSEIKEDAEQRYIFVPQKEWDKVSKRFKTACELKYCEPNEILESAASHWYKMAQLYK